MTLAFHQLFPAELPLIGNKKTFFVFKIKKAIQLECLKHQQKILFNHGHIGDNLMDAVAPKLHTIREDKYNRWKPGNDIHFVINDRTRNREQFLPLVKCISTQKIKIIAKTCEVFVDNYPLSINAIKLLAINDGFTSVAEFFAYFNTDFTGKLIHWTHLKY
jgi:hypothetical protein